MQNVLKHLLPNQSWFGDRDEERQVPHHYELMSSAKLNIHSFESL